MRSVFYRDNLHCSDKIVGSSQGLSIAYCSFEYIINILYIKEETSMVLEGIYTMQSSIHINVNHSLVVTFVSQYKLLYM